MNPLSSLVMAALVIFYQFPGRTSNLILRVVLACFASRPEPEAKPPGEENKRRRRRFWLQQAAWETPMPDQFPLGSVDPASSSELPPPRHDIMRSHLGPAPVLFYAGSPFGADTAAADMLRLLRVAPIVPLSPLLVVVMQPRRLQIPSTCRASWIESLAPTATTLDTDGDITPDNDGVSTFAGAEKTTGPVNVLEELALRAPNPQLIPETPWLSAEGTPMNSVKLDSRIATTIVHVTEDKPYTPIGYHEHKHEYPMFMPEKIQRVIAVPGRYLAVIGHGLVEFSFLMDLLSFEKINKKAKLD
ncbi:hypothetical protein B0T24DRAFT_682395 [Lasiosphaeria ovina]|uniref:Uncharacterized protein n=1 Tax=Lasiosphaeria ovina TaxID=92902 RepID=A0AAE0K0E3_9PEZI|nr:hypothetical protein B0T24DRAFT_682395 [Lasiosphaeria ovina]